MNYLLGIDVGTASAKVILFDEYGNAVATGEGGYETVYPGANMAEQDGEHWWKAVKDALLSITASFDIRANGSVSAISVSSQAPSLLPVDFEGKPLRPAPIWMDSRAGREYREIIEKVGLEEFESIVGGRPDPFYLLSKLYWYKHNEPDNYKKTATVLQANGYIVYKLTGKFSIDVTHGIMTHCMDSHSLRWSEKLSEASGLDFEAVMPPIFNNMDIVGYTTNEAAAATGLSPGIPVIAGNTDTIASMLGLGLSSPGDAAEVTGASTLVFVGMDRFPASTGALSVRPTPISAIPYLLVGPASTSGASLKWFDMNFGQPERQQEAETGIGRYQLLDKLAESAPAGSGGLIYFPYMMGERAPLWNTHAKGMFIGLTLSTGRAEMVRAILEGTSFSMRHIMDSAKACGADIKHVRSAGGGSKSDIWLRIKASMLGLPIHVPDSKTAGASFGNALMAGAAVGIYPDIGTAAKELVQIKRVILPEHEWAKVYEGLYELYLDMYNSLDSGLLRLQKLVSDM